jgi:TonB family protein
MPREAIERGIEGDVHVVLLVDAAGRIAEVKVLQSPHVMLSEATVKAMQQ